MKEQIISDYKAGKSIRELAKIYPQCRKTIQKIIIESGAKIEFRDNGKRKHPLDHSYFEFIDSPQKAYFLGFLFADGFVLKNGIDSGMNLVKTDRVILEELSKVVYGSDEPVYDLKSTRGNAQPQSRIVFKSKEFQSHLLNKNMVHNKSLILAPPLNLPEKFIRYFIHGYFDGDGCFCNFITLISTQPFCQWVGDYLVSNGITSHFKIAPKTKNGTFTLSIWRVADIVSIYKLFYDDCPYVFLNRKKEKMKAFLEKRNLI